MLASRSRIVAAVEKSRMSVAQTRSSPRIVPAAGKREKARGPGNRASSVNNLEDFDSKVFVMITQSELVAYTSRSERDQSRTRRSSRASLQGVVKSLPSPPRRRPPPRSNRPPTLTQQLADLQERYNRSCRAQSKLNSTLLHKVARQQQELASLRNLIHGHLMAKKSSKSGRSKSSSTE